MAKEFVFEYYSKLVEYKGFKITTYVIGTGKNVVFSFPSFPHSGLYYLWFLTHYNLEKVRFVTFDLPGWIGYSDNIFKDKAFDIEDYLNIGKQVISTYNLDKFSVLGYSFGGGLAIRLAHDLKDQVEKLVLVSPVYTKKGINFTKEVKALSLIRMFGLNFLMKFYLLRSWNEYKPFLEKDGFPENYMNLYSAMIARIDSKILLESIYSLFQVDWSSYLESLLNKKILVVSSKGESKMFRQQAKMLREIIPESSSLYVYGKHEDFILRPKSETVRQVVNFLATE